MRRLLAGLVCMMLIISLLSTAIAEEDMYILQYGGSIEGYEYSQPFLYPSPHMNKLFE